MISAVSLQRVLVKDFWCVCLLGLFLPAAAATAQVSSCHCCKPSSCCTCSDGCPPEPPHAPAIPQTGTPRVTAVTWPCCACQQCDDQMEKTCPPTFSSGTWAGKETTTCPSHGRVQKTMQTFALAQHPLLSQSRDPPSAPAMQDPQPTAGLVHPPESPATSRAPRLSQTHKRFQPPLLHRRKAAGRAALGSTTLTTKGELKQDGASKQQMPPVQNNSHLLVHTANTR